MPARIATHAAVAELMRRYDYLPKKSLGQNFLTDPRVAEKIAEAARITLGDRVIEIGPGLGGLTETLTENEAAVLAVELDKRLVYILQKTFAGNNRVEIIQGDILKMDAGELMRERGWRTAKVVANLPYYITTPVLMGLLEGRLPLSVITVMVQKEVAGRLRAKPGSKEYGSLSVAAAYFADVTLTALVPRNCFFPRPHVDSAVVTLKLIDPRAGSDEEDLLFKCVKAAFGQRRKTLLNCLRAQTWINKGREELLTVMKGCGFDEDIRGEALSLDEFIRLARALKD
ncbi:MAG: 16S rRNA (adenine(1518)-N(6)/adenine(1519)-N(6))-dimethyltransferase RsmA [Clostridiales bacterium]|jgi:16S rRNA (adenine1518-N6/adenine1519-N6)-dimethyltransferase|nr:16S rRNA (adenine(1518)-N(6)/adenine(1519)-N(6))-dimethyltransferase RsmA [Clostridiales bacterium]